MKDFRTDDEIRQSRWLCACAFVIGILAMLLYLHW